MAQNDSKSAAPQLSAGDKCGDVCNKIGIACKLIGAIACGDLKMKTVKVGSSDCKTFAKLTPCLGDLYRSYFEKHANRGYLFTENDGEKLTFTQSLSVYESVGAELRAGFGLKVGDSVGICMRNLPEYILAFLAATSVGCRAVPLNSLWTTPELEFAVKDADCKVIFCDTQRLNLITPFAESAGCKLVLCDSKDQDFADKSGALMWDKVVADGKSKPQRPDTSSLTMSSDAMIMYTSGSTGKPKGVVHSQQSLGTAIVGQEIAGFATLDRGFAKAVLIVPLFHITGLTLALGAFVGAQEVHILRKWDAGKCLDIIENRGITRFIGVPTMVKDILEHPAFTVERLRTIKTIGGGGAAMPVALQAKMAQVTGKKSGVQGYGLTETCGACIANQGLDTLKQPKSTGKAFPFLVKACIKDPATGKVMPDGERGELCVLSALNMTRYHNRDEDTSKVLDKEGYFHTGDIAKIEGGFVFILDRLKDIIIRGGENIDCTEVEGAIYSNPKVRECSVFGLPDERLGEVVGCAIFPKEPMTPEDLNEYLKKSSLAKFKVPDAVNIFIHDEELPKGATFKIDRKGMREKYAAVVKARS